MTNKNDPIADSLGLTPITPSLPAAVKVVSTDVDTDNKNDFDVARENLHNLIVKGSDALDEIILIAKQSESARAFEVVSTLVKTLTDANKDLLELAEKKKKLFTQEQQKNPTTVNNNLYVGSTSDLVKMLKGEKDEPSQEG